MCSQVEPVERVNASIWNYNIFKCVGEHYIYRTTFNNTVYIVVVVVSCVLALKFIRAHKAKGNM